MEPTDERIEWLREETARWNAGSREDLDFDRVDPNFVLESALVGGEFHGADGLRKWFAEIDEQFEQWSLQNERVHPAGDDRVLFLYDLAARGRRSGLPIDQKLGIIFGFRGDKLASMRTFWGHEPARLAAGLGDP